MASTTKRASARRRRAAPPSRSTAPERKRDTTRAHLLASALTLFQERGVDATTMRDIAKAAGMSLGAAYYYFPSKEALVFAYYEDNQAAFEELARTATGTVRERLGTLFHGKLDSIRDQRKMLSTIVHRLADPSDPVGAFSAQTRKVRDRSIAVLDSALDGASLPADVRPVVAHALWLAQMATMLLFVHDDSPHQQRTHGLVDELLDLLVPLLPMLATPIGQALCGRITAALGRAGISLGSGDHAIDHTTGHATGDR
jgi:AcrR family transcriptional regulator